MLNLTFELTGPTQFLASHPELGKVATIVRHGVNPARVWEVHPYSFPAYERFGTFKGHDAFASLESAKLFCHVIAHEVVAIAREDRND